MVGQQEISYWINHPEALNKDSLYELRQILALYPYYQTARVLFLKNLFIMNADEFKDELQKGVLYVADMARLFQYIEGDRYAIVKHKTEEGTGAMSAADRTLLLINDFLNSSDAEPNWGEVELIPETTPDYSVLLAQEEGSEESTADVPQMKGQELIDKFIEKSEEGARYQWYEGADADGETYESDNSKTDASNNCTTDEEVVLESADANTSENATAKTHDENQESLEIMATSADVADKNEIDEPRLGSESQKENFDVLAASELDDIAEYEDSNLQEDNTEDSSLSETLAKIYVKQQRYDKALEIIKKLNLKNPKKNTYFADQIRFLEKLIINTKSK